MKKMKKKTLMMMREKKRILKFMNKSQLITFSLNDLLQTERLCIYRLQRGFGIMAQSISDVFRERSNFALNLLYQQTSDRLDQSAFLNTHIKKAVYCGYDPTAPSLHLGNLASIIMMTRLHMLGLQPILLVGGATGMIGDPSGKSKDRNFIDAETMQSNCDSINTQLASTYSSLLNHLKANKQLYTLSGEAVTRIDSPVTIKNNIEFYKNLTVIEFLREVGRHFRIGEMLRKDVVCSRLQSQQGLSFIEFTYTIIQAYDYYQLHQKHECILQIGGSDQWTNITHGCDLIRKITATEAYGITMPLLADKTGQKFGKSEGNALYLDKSMTPANDLYQYLYNQADDEVEHLLKVYTYYPLDSIGNIMQKHFERPQLRHAQTILANTVISYLEQFTNLIKEIITAKREHFEVSRTYSDPALLVLAIAL